jgi:adenylate cyclase
LRVSHVLEGSVQRAGETIRVTAQLINTSDGSHLWSQTYDRPITDIFNLQDDISATVARALQAALESAGSGSGKAQTNTTAYNLWLEAEFFRKRTSRMDTRKAIDLYQQAINIDGNYAEAWRDLARAYAQSTVFSETPRSEYIRKAHKCVKRALDIDPNLADAHDIHGFLLAAFDWNWIEAARAFRRAHELGQTDWTTKANLAEIAASFGALNQAIDAERVFLAHDPLSTTKYWYLGIFLLGAGRYDDAAVAFRRISELNPSFPGARAWQAGALLLQGRKDEALEAVEQESDDGWKISISPIVYWELGRKSDSDAALHRLEEQYAEGFAYNVAEMHAYRGELDSAINWLERAYQQHDDGMSWIRIDPFLQNLHSDNRYKALVARIKLEGDPPEGLSRLLK